MRRSILIALLLCGFTGFSQTLWETVKVPVGYTFFTGSLRIASVTDYGAIADDGLEDSTAFIAAAAANETVFVPDGEYNVNGGWGAINQKTIYGSGRNSIIKVDSLRSILTIVDSCTVHDIHFKGTVGAGSLPVGVFTTQNGIHIIGNGNNVHDCWFSGLEAGITGWHGVNIYNNRISNSYATYCTVGFFYVSAFDYNITTGCDAAYCTVGFYEFSSSNNRWVNITASYCIDGFRLVGNGDHGTLASSTMNHNNVNLNLQSVTYSYIISDCNFFAGAIQFGGTDTVRNVTIDNCVFQDATISGNKTLNTVIRGPFFRHDVTVTSTTLMLENVRTDSPGSSPSQPFYPNVFTGTTIPAITPKRIGDFFIDGTNSRFYFAKGTSSSSDWIDPSGIGGGITSLGTGYGLTGGTITTTGTVTADTANQLASKLRLYKVADSLGALIAVPDGVTSVGTGYGLTGGTITATGTITADTTNQLASKLRLYKVADSLGALIGGPAGVGGSTGSTDNRILRADGTGGATLQNSLASINDAGEIITPFMSLIDAGTASEIYNNSAVTGNTSGLWFLTDNGSSGASGTIKFLTGSFGFEVASNAGVTTRLNLIYGGNTAIIDIGNHLQLYGGSSMKTSLGANGVADYFIINTAGAASMGVASADASSIMDLTSTTKGFLPPRMTATQASAISSPAEGLIIYVTNTNATFTTKGWWGWNGSAWQQF